MGQLGREISRAKQRHHLIDDLLRAYSDEWFAHYNYRFVAHVLRGHRAPSVTELLARKSDEAFTRANRIAERVLEVGGKLVERLTELPKHATDKPFKLPKSWTDTESVLK